MKTLLASILIFGSLCSPMAFAETLDESTAVIMHQVGACSEEGLTAEGLVCTNRSTMPQCGRCQRAEPRYCRSRGGHWYQCGWVCVFDTYTCGS